MTTGTPLPLEDELGDVLEKAMQHADLTPLTLAQRSGVEEARIIDAIDYRPDLTCDELRRIAAALSLNEVGLCALGSGQYPRPEIGALPFCVWPLPMPHGIGMANAFLVGECASSHAILFDTGSGIDALQTAWPASVRHLDAVFLTHLETEHAGGLCEVVARYGLQHAYIPCGTTAPCGQCLGEGRTLSFGVLEVAAFTTPGHVAAHNCYVVRAPAAANGAGLLVSGDLVFAGSAGGAQFSPKELQSNLRRMLSAVPPDTVIAPGHGPLTTVANELRYNPFVA